MNEYTAQLRSKGWTARAVAKRWKISISTMTRITRKPNQKHLDALYGLPNLLEAPYSDYPECEKQERASVKSRYVSMANPSGIGDRS